MNMTTLKIADKEYKIKYGYEATVKSGIIKKLTAFSTEKAEKDGMEYIDMILLIVPELLLVGLQKFHADEFGFNPDDQKEKEQQMSKVYALMDDYFDSEDGDIGTLFDILQKEMLENGFLAKMLRKKRSNASLTPAEKENEEISTDQKEN